MKQLTLSVVLVICGFYTTKAQNKTYFGLEASIFSDHTKIQDSGDWLTTTVLSDPMGGGHIRQEFGKNLFCEAGVMIKPFWRGYTFKSIFIPVMSVNYFSWLIPMRAGTAIDLHREKIYVVPVIGYTFGIQPSMQLRQGSGTREFKGNTFVYTDSENPDVARQFSLIQAGIGIEFKFFKTLLLSFNTNYYKGLTRISQIDISYTVNGSGPFTGSAISRGDFWCLGTALKYPVSRR
jgi:hypothetical protein